jgi:hypothetical protein
MRLLSTLPIGAVLLGILACGGEPATSAGQQAPCSRGTERCDCNDNGTCSNGLSCLSGLCVRESSSDAGGAGGVLPDSSPASGGAGGVTGTGGTTGTPNDASAGGAGAAIPDVQAPDVVDAAEASIVRCTGTPVGTCAASGLCDIIGCSSISQCHGSASSCSWWSCYSGKCPLAGCSYVADPNPSNCGKCTGTPKPCTDINDQHDCSLLSCAWQTACVGTPTPCEQLDDAQCSVQFGCMPK